DDDDEDPEEDPIDHPADGGDDSDDEKGSDALSSRTPLLLPISASTSSSPLQLPSASRMEDRPEVTIPPQKRLGIALGPGYEVGESSSSATARPTGDAGDLVRGEVMSLCTTVLGQMTEIRELHVVDRRRQIVISELLRADHRRSTEIIELRTALQGQVTALQGHVIALQAQVTALQGQQGLAGGPIQPEIPEEAGSGS
nr:hypothetical protein [Tanacetum cinerariifolium]